MEIRRTAKLPEIDVTPLEEQLDERRRQIQNPEPKQNTMQLRRDFDCLALSKVLGWLANGPDEGTSDLDLIDDILSFADESRDTFAYPTTFTAIKESTGNSWYGVEFDRLLSKLAEQVNDFYSSYQEQPSVPLETLVAFAGLVGNDTDDRAVLLTTAVKVYEGEAARDVFMQFSDELITKMCEGSYQEQSRAARHARMLLEASVRNYDGILSGDDESYRKKLKDLSVARKLVKYQHPSEFHNIRTYKGRDVREINPGDFL